MKVRSIFILVLILIQCTAIREFFKSDVKTIDSRYLKEQTEEEKRELEKLVKQLIDSKNDMKKAEQAIGVTKQKLKISQDFLVLYDLRGEKEKYALEKLHKNYLQATLNDDEAIFKLKQAELAKIKAEKDFLEAKIAKRNQADNIEVELYESNLNSKIKELAEAKSEQVATNAQKQILEEQLKNHSYKGWQ